MNRVFLLGNLGKDPEIRYTQSGAACTTFSLATSESYQNPQGEKINNTTWHRVVTWNKVAENCHRYLHKGSKVLVEGKINYREWTDRDGAKRYMTEIVATTCEFLGDSNRQRGYQPPNDEYGGYQQSNNTAQQGQAYAQGQTYAQDGSTEQPEVDQVPF